MTSTTQYELVPHKPLSVYLISSSTIIVFTCSVVLVFVVIFYIFRFLFFRHVNLFKVNSSFSLVKPFYFLMWVKENHSITVTSCSDNVYLCQRWAISLFDQAFF